MPLSLDRFHPLWKRQLRAWQARLPQGWLLGTTEELLDELQGALWLEMHRHPQPNPILARQALRRVLYRDFEASWVHRIFPFEEALDSPAALGHSPVEGTLVDLPAGLRPIAHSYLAGDGPEGNLRRGVQQLGSRRRVRLFNTLLMAALSVGPPLQDLKRRMARLCVAVSHEGMLPAHRRQARTLNRALSMLEQTEEIRGLRRALSGIVAARKPEDHAESPGYANACTGPRATAQGK